MSHPKTALVTRVSRATYAVAAPIALFEAGCKVYATGRTISRADLPNRILRIPCDHLQDDQIAAAYICPTPKVPSSRVVRSLASSRTRS